MSEWRLGFLSGRFRSNPRFDVFGASPLCPFGPREQGTVVMGKESEDIAGGQRRNESQARG